MGLAVMQKKGWKEGICGQKASEQASKQRELTCWRGQVRCWQWDNIGWLAWHHHRGQRSGGRDKVRTWKDKKLVRYTHRLEKAG